MNPRSDVPTAFAGSTDTAAIQAGAPEPGSRPEQAAEPDSAAREAPRSDPAAQDPARASAEDPPTPLHGSCILVVDDDEDFAFTIADILRARGAQPMVALSAEAALQQIWRQPPQAAVVDLRIGSADGVELIDQLRAGDPDLPCVIATAYASLETAVAAIDRGVSAYLRKPVDPGELISSLSRLLRTRVAEAERDAALDMLRASEMRYRETFEQAAVGLAHVDGDGRLLRVNERLAGLLGRSPEQLRGRTVSDLEAPEAAESPFSELLRRVLETGSPGAVDTAYRSPDGAPLWVSQTLSASHDAQGRVEYLILAVQDIRARRNAQEDLRRQLSIQTSLTDVAQLILTEIRNPDRVREETARILAAITGTKEVWIVEWDARTEKVISWLHASRNGSELGFEHPSGKPDQTQLPGPVARPTGLDPVPGESAADHPPRGGEEQPPRSRTLPVRAEEQLFGWIHLDALPPRRGHGRQEAAEHLASLFGMAALAWREERERASLQQQLRHAQKMEAIGTLAGGIAHDFNNLLLPIIGYTEFAREAAPADSGLDADLEHVLTAARRATELTRQILTFSRRSDTVRKPLDVTIITKEVARLLRATLPPGVELEVDIETGSLTVDANATQIHQVLVNLCTNGLHAMRETQGTLRIRLEGVGADAWDEDAPADATSTEPDGAAFACFEVSDTGAGIPPEIQERIFDPFFTSKPVGEGTGLGLSVVHGIVKDHGGSIRFRSEPGRGTTFTCLLPLSRADEADTEVDPAQVPRGAGTVLVLDEDPEVAAFEQRALQQLGYEAVAVQTADRARDILTAPDVRLVGVLCDYGRRGQDGIELLRSLRALAPDLPMLLCTGHAVTVGIRRSLPEGPVEVLEKPFTVAELGFALQRASGGAPPG